MLKLFCVLVETPLTVVVTTGVVDVGIGWIGIEEEVFDQWTDEPEDINVERPALTMVPCDENTVPSDMAMVTVDTALVVVGLLVLAMVLDEEDVTALVIMELLVLAMVLDEDDVEGGAAISPNFGP